jgi:MFS family permease
VAGTDDSTLGKSSQQGFTDEMRSLLSSPEAQPPTLSERVEQSPAAAFAPWIIYWVVANSDSNWLYGAVAAVLVAIIFAAPTIRAGRIKWFDAVTIVFFVGLIIAGLVVGAQDKDFMDNYAQVFSMAVLAAIAFGSLLFTPFTEQYAPDNWDTPSLKRINRVLTLVWGLVFAAVAVLGFIADREPTTDNWTNWVIPIVLLALAIRFTQLYPPRAIARAQRTQ